MLRCRPSREEPATKSTANRRRAWRRALAVAIGASTAGILMTTAASPAPYRLTAAVAPPHVEGTQIVDGNGHSLLLQGAMIETSFGYINDWNKGKDPLVDASPAAFAAMSSWRMNYMRTLISAWMYHLTFPGTGETYLSKLDTAIQGANAAGQYVVLDFHSDSQSGLPGSADQSGQPYTSGVLYSETLQFWKDIATRYAANPMVMYDVINEPQYTDWNTWMHGVSTCDRTKPGCIVGVQDAIDTIRSTGSRQIIVVEPGKAGGSQSNESGGWINLPAGGVTSDANIVYSKHEYTNIIAGYVLGASKNPPDYSLWDNTWAPGQILGVHPIFYGEWALLPHGQPAHCEGTLGGTSFQLTSQNADAVERTWLTYMQTRGANFTAWTFKGYENAQHTQGDPKIVVDNVNFAPSDFTSNGPWRCADNSAAALNSGMGVDLRDFMLRTHPTPTPSPSPTGTPTPTPTPSPSPTPTPSTGGVVLDAMGGLYPYGGWSGSTAGAPSWPNWAIARGVATRPGGGGYVLDGWGGVHPFGGAPVLATSAYWPNWDIARAIALTPDGKGGYVLDGWGGLHPIGSAPPLATSAYWPQWDIARGIALTPDGEGGYVLDGWGGVHPFGSAPALTTSAYWPNWDIARGIALLPDGSGGWVLDGWGGLHPFGGAGTIATPSYWPNWDIARAVVATGPSGAYVLDGWGGIHPAGTATVVSGTGYWPGQDLARGLTH